MKFNSPVNRRRTSGLSLLETLIAASIGSIVLAALGALAIFTARSFVAAGNYADLDRASRNALDIITRDIRESRGLNSYSSNMLSIASYTNGSSLVLEWKPATGELTRTASGQTTVLLKQCDYLNFHVYQRRPTNNWNWYSVGSMPLSEAKLIDVSWKCSRKILGQKVNTESVQTAKIVIRN